MGASYGGPMRKVRTATVTQVRDLDEATRTGDTAGTLDALYPETWVGYVGDVLVAWGPEKDEVVRLTKVFV